MILPRSDIHHIVAAPVSPSAPSSSSRADTSFASPSFSASSSPSSTATLAAMSPALATALAHHRQGALDAARHAYEHLISSPETHASQAVVAHHWLGVLHLQQRRAQEAQVCFEKVLALAPANFASQLNLGHARLQMGDTVGASNAYQAASHAPEAEIAAAAFAAIAGEHTRCAVSNTASAKDLDDAAASSFPSPSPSLRAALAALDRAIALQPELPAFHDSRGSVLNILGQYAEAEHAHRAALTRQGAHPGFHNNLGLAVKAQGRIEDAIWHFRDALRLDPDHVPALINLGQAVAMTGDYDQASAPLTRAIAIAPDNAAAHHELGNVFAAMADYGNARTHYARAVALEPHAALAWQNLGAMQFELGNANAAGEAFEKALDIHPTLALARFNLASIQLAQGDWQHGWAGYEARLAVWRSAAMPTALTEQAALPGVRWRGEQVDSERIYRDNTDGTIAPPATDAQTDTASSIAIDGTAQQGYFPLRGRRILVYAEQGLGDTIQFFRFGAQVAAVAEHVTLLLPASLCSLLAPAAAALAGNITVVSMGEDNRCAYADTNLDCHCPLLSLPFALGITRLDALLDPGAGYPHGHASPAAPPYVAALTNTRTPPQWTQPLPTSRRGAKTRLFAKRAVHRIAHMARISRLTRAGRLSRATMYTAPRALAGHASHASSAAPAAPAARTQHGSPKNHAIIHKVGLVWSGKRPEAPISPASSSSLAADEHSSRQYDETRYDKRAISLDALQPLFDLPNIEWHVLQTEMTQADKETLKALMATYPIVWRSPAFQDFADTAQAISELDHIVSIDTSVAHLAGAMGWPVSLMLPLAADWRWANAAEKPSSVTVPEGKDTASVASTPNNWYPSVRSFKQVDRNDWPPVVQAVAQSLITRFKLDVTKGLA